MSRILYRVLTSWGMVLGIIPFIVLLVFGLYSIASSAQGAAAVGVSSWVAKVFVTAILSLILSCGIAAALAWYDEKKTTTSGR